MKPITGWLIFLTPNGRPCLGVLLCRSSAAPFQGDPLGAISVHEPWVRQTKEWQSVRNLASAVFIYMWTISEFWVKKYCLFGVSLGCMFYYTGSGFLETLAKTRQSHCGDRSTTGGMSHPCPVTKEGREGEKEGQRDRGRQGNIEEGEMGRGRDERVPCNCHLSRNSEGWKQVCIEWFCNCMYRLLKTHVRKFS